MIKTPERTLAVHPGDDFDCFFGTWSYNDLERLIASGSVRVSNETTWFEPSLGDPLPYHRDHKRAHSKP
jgi:hypothetical protein